MQDRLGTSPAYHLLHTFWAAVDWIYPPHCGGCRRLGFRWCPDCDAQTEKVNASLSCPVCGIPHTGHFVCANCQASHPPYTALRSWAVYQSGLREAIHSLKFHSDLGLAEIFALKLSALYVSLGWSIDLVTAVPLSPGRRRERGFNQADLLARYFALSTGLPFWPTALKRTRETQSQVGLSAHERHHNVQGAFLADAHLMRGKNVLIIDDVTTTGATLSECAQACLKSSATNVFGLTIARAVLAQHS